MTDDAQTPMNNDAAVDAVIVVGADQKDFDRLAADHDKWRRVAGHLFAAAEKLWPDIEASFQGAGDGHRLRGPFYLLVGLALENLAKAIIVKRQLGRGLSVTENDVLKLGGNHDLHGVMRDAGISFTDIESSILSQLTRFVQWQGRYPVPLRADRLGSNTVTTVRELDNMRSLYQKVENDYLSIPVTAAAMAEQKGGA